MRGRGGRRREPEEEEGEGWRERPLKQWVASIISFFFFFHPGLLKEGGVMASQRWMLYLVFVWRGGTEWEWQRKRRERRMVEVFGYFSSFFFVI